MDYEEAPKFRLMDISVEILEETYQMDVNKYNVMFRRLNGVRKRRNKVLSNALNSKKFSFG